MVIGGRDTEDFMLGSWGLGGEETGALLLLDLGKVRFISLGVGSAFGALGLGAVLGGAAVVFVCEEPAT